MCIQVLLHQPSNAFLELRCPLASQQLDYLQDALSASHWGVSLTLATETEVSLQGRYFGMIPEEYFVVLARIFLCASLQSTSVVCK